MSGTSRVATVLTLCWGALTVLCLPAASTLSAEGDLYAVASGSHLGELYKIDPTDASSTLIGQTGVGFQALAYSPHLGMLLGVDDASGAVLAIDQSDATTSPVLDGLGQPISVSTSTVFGLAYYPRERALYGVDDNWMTFRTSLGTGDTEVLGPVGYTLVRGLGADPATGTIYGYYEPAGTDHLITIDRTSGAGTMVGDTQIGDGDGLTFDPLRNVLYTRDRDADILFAIDPATAQATPIGFMRAYGVFGMAVEYVPEPSTILMLAAAAAASLVVYGWRRRGA